jgi:DNA-binding transcriptional LysR family regulator
MDFEIRLLRCALSLAEHRHFARAAHSLHLSQPSLSRSIQNLEKQAGVRIFERGTHGVEVTDAGGIFLEHAREVMSQSSDLSREMELLRGLGKGELQVGVGTYVGLRFVDRVIARIVRDHPEVRLRVANDNWANLLPLLRRRELDLAVADVRAITDDQDFLITRLTRRQGYLAVRPGHPLLKKKRALSMSDVLNYPFVSTSRFPSAMLREFMSESAAGESPSPRGPRTVPSIACESLGMMKTIAQESDAVALLTLNVLIPELEAQTIAVLPVALPVLQGEFGIVRLARRSLSPLGELFFSSVLQMDAEVADMEGRASKKLFPIRQQRVRTAHA